jgi:hypothetical protein
MSCATESSFVKVTDWPDSMAATDGVRPVDVIEIVAPTGPGVDESGAIGEL